VCKNAFLSLGSWARSSFRASLLLFLLLLFLLLFLNLYLFIVAWPPCRAEGQDHSDAFVETVMALAKPLTEGSSRFGFILEAVSEDGPSLLDARVAEGGPATKPQFPPGSVTRNAGLPSRIHRLTIVRSDEESWSLKVESSWRDVFISHQPGQTNLAVPRERTVFVGKGGLPAGSDNISAKGLSGRLITPETSLYPFLAILGPTTLEAGLRRLVLPSLLTIPAGSTPSVWVSWGLKGGGTISVNASGPSRLVFSLASDSRGLAGLHSFSIESITVPDTGEPAFAPDVRVVKVSRVDLEKMLFRGLFRALSVKFPGSPVLARAEPRTVPHGDLRHIGGQILVRLSGTPSQIGTAHGMLLRQEIRRTVDSTIYLAGLVATIEKGKWFLDELEDAWRRLSPHIPSRHLEEMDAIVSACPGISIRETRLSNIFPEYFHCSGFAVFGRATADGTLYHGRVLDYMTEIGLQQCAVAFVVKPDGYKAFLNASFSGFQGSVSGMNEAGISLGEMGGGGRYQWDGVPMATLMRRALEECDSLSQVKNLWAGSPRTCEYYYVFADGKIPSAVGMKATPQGLEFLDAGQAHPQVGEGIADTVVMSAGQRLNHLRRRLISGHGSFTATSAIGLMDRPVAMRSNLHNVLFVPGKGEAYIANADSERPAADCPYTRYDFSELLRDIPR